MANGYNTEQSFFTTGAGNQPASANNYMPENNLDLSSNQTWNTMSSHSEASPNAIFSAESMPNSSDVTVLANLPPMYDAVSPSQDIAVPSPAKHNLSMSGDKISHAATAEIASAVGNFQRGNENVATFYDEIRDAAESFRNNSFGARK